MYTCLYAVRFYFLTLPLTQVLNGCRLSTHSGRR